ncbi:solute carrier family 22 member 18-like [Watersipora subatra]|uniref:solute carrier family 22 member 18-like n=1 Tax=Watersipora subatra TaxID=2589382 RepID=UPI00355C54FB
MMTEADTGGALRQRTHMSDAPEGETSPPTAPGEDSRRGAEAPADTQADYSVKEDFSSVCVIRVVQLNVILYSTCFWIQQSCFPYLSKKLGVDNITYGYLQTAFAVFQLVGGPLFGRFGDLMGARAALTLAYASGILTYGVLAFASSIPMLFLSRAMSLFLACMQGSQMVITDIVAPEKRADALGKLGLFYGVGMVIGPTLGGQITQRYGEEAAAMTATVGSLISMLTVIYYIPKHVKHVRTEEQSVANVFSFGEIARLMANREAAFLLIIKTVVGIPIGILQSVFSRVAMTIFNLPADYNGMVMSYVGIVTMLVQGVGVGILTKRYKDLSLMKFSTIIATFAYILVAQVTSIEQFCVTMLPLIVGMTTLQVVISAAITKVVDPKDTGAMIGLGMATNSLIRTVGPTLGAYMLEIYGYSSIGYFGMIVCAVVSASLFRY